MTALVPLSPVGQEIRASVFALDGGGEFVTGVVAVVHTVHVLMPGPIVVVEREVDLDEVFHIPHEVVAVGRVVDRELVEREDVKDDTPVHWPQESLLIEVVVERELEDREARECEVVEFVVMDREVERDVVDHEVDRDDVTTHGPQAPWLVTIVIGREVVEDVLVGREVVGCEVVGSEVLPQGFH